MYQSLLKSMDKGLITFAVFLDFAKGFDSVNYKILLDKLQHYSIRGLSLQLFNSYLSERTQFVYLHNSCSNKLNVVCGVPQGPVLGRLLF